MFRRQADLTKSNSSILNHCQNEMSNYDLSCIDLSLRHNEVFREHTFYNSDDIVFLTRCDSNHKSLGTYSM